MLSGRMLKIIEYLNYVHNTTYKEIAKELNINDRYIRYDIDKINVFLTKNQHPLIEKRAKGVIVLSHNIDVSLLSKNTNFVYSAEERMALILLMLLFDCKSMKKQTLCQDFNVSRTTIKNDLIYLKQKLSEYNIHIEYQNHFYLKISNRIIINIMNHELSKYIYILEDNYKSLSTYESYAFHIIKRAFIGVDIKAIMEWINDIIDKSKIELNDVSYNWFVSSVFILVWHIIHNVQLPQSIGFDATDVIDKYQDYILSLEKLINNEIKNYYRGTLIRLIEYLDVNAGVYLELDSIYIQTIVSQLIELMSRQLNVDFSEDPILIRGLTNHVIPLIKRIFTHHYIDYNIVSVIPKDDYVVYQTLEHVLKEIDILNTLDNKNEITYLSIHFIASFHKLNKLLYKSILIVCNHGYGSSTILKESLINEFQVKVIDIIPSYKLSTYPHLEEVDCIISTLPLKDTYHKKTVIINPILNEYDYIKLKNIGIERKEMKLNYYSLNRRLDFLNEKDRKKVLHILESELGYQETRTFKNKFKISDLLQEECIKIIDKKLDSQDAILQSTLLLENNYNVVSGYGHKIIEKNKQIGFCCVKDKYFALLSGESDDVYHSAISLIVNKQEMIFNDKKVNIVFCMAIKDKADQILIMILLMRIINRLEFFFKIMSANTPKEILGIVVECENRK